MSDLLLPASVRREILKDRWAEQRREWRAKLEALFDFQDPVCLEWNPDLKELDPLLRLGRARPLAYEPGWTVQPGFYHWVRDNETAAPTVTPITGPDESFREPDSGVLEDLRRSDLRNPRVFAMLLAQRQVREEQQRLRVERDREERQQEMLDRYLAGNRAFVSTSTGSSWSQSARGRRGGG